MDLSHICRNCGTDIREGQHRVIEQHSGGITIRCTVPRTSELPRMVQFLADTKQVPSEYWYQQPRNPVTEDMMRRIEAGEGFR